MDRRARRLLRKPSFVEGLADLGHQLDVPARSLRRRARSALREMWSKHAAFESTVWRQLGRFFLRNYEVVVEGKGHDLNAIDAEHPLLILFSHRSYLDDWLVGEGLRRQYLVRLGQADHPRCHVHAVAEHVPFFTQHGSEMEANVRSKGAAGAVRGCDVRRGRPSGTDRTRASPR